MKYQWIGNVILTLSLLFILVMGIFFNGEIREGEEEFVPESEIFVLKSEVNDPYHDEAEYLRRRKATCEKLRSMDVWKSLSENGIKKTCKPFLNTGE